MGKIPIKTKKKKKKKKWERKKEEKSMKTDPTAITPHDSPSYLHPRSTNPIPTTTNSTNTTTTTIDDAINTTIPSSHSTATFTTLCIIGCIGLNNGSSNPMESI